MTTPDASGLECWVQVLGIRFANIILWSCDNGTSLLLWLFNFNDLRLLRGEVGMASLCWRKRWRRELDRLNWRRLGRCNFIARIICCAWLLTSWASVVAVWTELSLRSNKLKTTGQFPMLLTMLIADQTFWYSSLELLMMHTFVMGFTYFTWNESTDEARRPSPKFTIMLWLLLIY
jgi:hypothetical protein